MVIVVDVELVVAVAGVVAVIFNTAAADIVSKLFKQKQQQDEPQQIRPAAL